MKRFAALFACMAAIGLWLPTAAAAEEQQSPTLQVEPAVAEHTIDHGDQFDIPLAITSPETEALAVRLAVVGATTGEGSGVGYSSAPDAGASSWVTLERGAVELASEETVVVSAKVTVPQRARAGDLRVADGAAVQLAVTIENRGDLRSGGTGRLRLTEIDADSLFEIGTVLPGASTEISVPWTHMLEAGSYAATVEITDDLGRWTTWDGEVVIDDDFTAVVPGETAAAPVPAPFESNRGGLVSSAVAAIAGAVVIMVFNHFRNRRGRPRLSRSDQ